MYFCFPNRSVCVWPKYNLSPLELLVNNLLTRGFFISIHSGLQPFLVTFTLAFICFLLYLSTHFRMLITVYITIFFTHYFNFVLVIACFYYLPCVHSFSSVDWSSVANRIFLRINKVSLIMIKLPLQTAALKIPATHLGPKYMPFPSVCYLVIIF